MSDGRGLLGVIKNLTDENDALKLELQQRNAELQKEIEDQKTRFNYLLASSLPHVPKGTCPMCGHPSHAEVCTNMTHGFDCSCNFEDPR